MSLEKILSDLQKTFGKDAIGTADEVVKSLGGYTTGSLQLDSTLGGYGFPRGRLTEIYGPESCLSGDSFINYTLMDGDSIVNKKGGTLRTLYLRFKGLYEHHLQSTKNLDFYTLSENVDGVVFRNKIIDVVKCGVKPTYRLVTSSGNELKATLDHKIKTPTGFKRLGDLKVNDEIIIHNKTRIKGKKPQSRRKSICVKNHPTWAVKEVFDKKTGNTYVYKRGQLTHLILEASWNNMTTKAYRSLLNSGKDLSKIKTIPRGMHVHHIDEDYTNNSLNNLQVIDPSNHGKHHAIGNKNLNYITVTDVVSSITYEKEEMTYDLKCLFPHNNYIANNIVVHNSGKTTACIHAIADAQSRGDKAVFVDLEGTFDKVYARNLGVNTEELIIIPPNAGERAMEMAEKICKSGEIGILVIDSVAALLPGKIEDEEYGKANMAYHAKLVGEVVKRFVPIQYRNKIAVIAINQIREKPGVSFGNPEYSTGGNSLKFYAAVRLDIRKSGSLYKDKEGNVIGEPRRIKVVKSKINASANKTMMVDIVYGEGIDQLGEVVDASVDLGFIEKSGSWYSYDGAKIGQGREAAKQFLIDNEELYKELREKVINDMIIELSADIESE